MSPAFDHRQRPSCAWAMETALRLRGVDSVPAVLLFGLGGGAWCDVSTQADGSLRLRGLHADRIKLAFYALNVWSVCLRYLSTDATAQLRERCEHGLQTLLAIDSVALAGAEIAADEANERIVLVTGMRREEGGDLVQLRTVYAPEGIELPLQSLQRAWFRRATDGVAATFYWHPLVELRWEPRDAVVRALRRFAHRMRVRYPSPSGDASGLAAIELLATAPPPAAALRRSAEYLCEDGGAGLYREHMADFLRSAAELLAQPVLLDCADRYERAAALWRLLLTAAAQGRDAALNAALLADIAALERGALGDVERACIGQGQVAHA